MIAARLSAAGAPLLSSPSDDKDGNRGLWTVDPDGTRIELRQMRANSLQYQAIARLTEARAKIRPGSDPAG